MNDIVYKINVALGYIKKKVNGNWVDNHNKPAIILSDKFKKYKIPIQNVPILIEDLQNCLDAYTK